MNALIGVILSVPSSDSVPWPGMPPPIEQKPDWFDKLLMIGEQEVDSLLDRVRRFRPA